MNTALDNIRKAANGIKGLPDHLQSKIFSYANKNTQKAISGASRSMREKLEPVRRVIYESSTSLKAVAIVTDFMRKVADALRPGEEFHMVYQSLLSGKVVRVIHNRGTGTSLKLLYVPAPPYKAIETPYASFEELLRDVSRKELRNLAYKPHLMLATLNFLIYDEYDGEREEAFKRMYTETLIEPMKRMLNGRLVKTSTTNKGEIDEEYTASTLDLDLVLSYGKKYKKPNATHVVRFKH